MKNKKGISLIVLIVTIIVITILAAVVILTLSKNNPIESAKEARFKEDVRIFQDELALAVSKEYANAGGQRDEKITTSDFDAIKEYIPSFNEKYKDKFVIQDDELRYTKEIDEREMSYLQSLNVNSERILPDEYQQVEYIESTGTQYIITDISLSKSNTIDVIWMLTENVYRQNQFVFGARDSATNNNLEFYKNIDGYINLDYGNYQDNRIQIETIRVNKWYETKITKELFTNNDIECNVSNTNEFVTPPIYIFYANNIFSGFPMKGKIKMFEIENVANFIPCYSTTTVTDVNGKSCPNGTKGLYDTVEGKFYTNQGTGEDFIPGPDVD